MREAIKRPYRGNPEAIKRQSRGHQEVIKRPSRGHPEAIKRGNQEAIQRPSRGRKTRTFETMNESVPTLGGEALLYMPKGELPSRLVVACIA